MLVALSYPRRFEVQRRASGGSWSTAPYGSRAYGGFGGVYDPIWYDALYPYYVTPFGYSSWGRGYNPYYYGALASPFVVIPSTGDDGRTATARAYRERGYTRVRPREAGPGVVQRGGSQTSGGGSGGTVSRGGTATRGGYTSGGSSSGGGSRSGSGGGRRAVPRR